MIAENTREQQKVKQQIGEYEARVQSSPVIEQEYKELTRGYQTALETYNELQKKRDDSAIATRLEREQEGEQFTILDPANLPDTPSFPDRMKFTLGGFGGGFALGLGLAMLFEQRLTFATAASTTSRLMARASPTASSSRASGERTVSSGTPGASRRTG